MSQSTSVFGRRSSRSWSAVRFLFAPCTTAVLLSWSNPAATAQATALQLGSPERAESSLPAFAARSSRSPRSFQRVSTFEVHRNSDPTNTTVSEIIAASKDGKTLIYTDAELEAVGFIDIADPNDPVPLGTLDLPGSPTSVAVTGDYALVAVDTSESFTEPSGVLVVVDLPTLEVIHTMDLGGQPDSVAIDPFENFAAIVIENQRDEDIDIDGVEGGLPQLPPGRLLSIRLGDDPWSWTLRPVELTGLSDYAPDDPEPEFVDINAFGLAAVTLQENNHIVLVNLWTNRVFRDFPAGTVDLRNVDAVDDAIISPTDSIDAVAREPDALTWVTPWLIATANEGDFVGGSRGFSIFDLAGRVVYDSGADFEHLAMQIGHYPENRSDAKGSEPEAIEFGRYGRDDLIFVGSERGSFVAVYKHDWRGKDPELVQVLPAGMAPEGLLAIPDRDLFVVSSENDEDGPRASVTIYRREHKAPDYPTIVSSRDRDGLPIAWSALSALAADRWNKNILYSVEDSAYRRSRIFVIDVARKPAVIRRAIVLHDADGNTFDLDPEGVVQRANGGFWVASEGDPAGGTSNLLLAVDRDGLVTEEIPLPPDVQAIERSNGYEGVAVTGHGSSEQVYLAIQRPWEDFEDTQLTRIARYTPKSGEWTFFHYPLDPVESPAGGWVGLSEIVALDDDTLAVIERDNAGGPDARVKRLYSFSIAGMDPAPHGEPIPVVSKTLLRDVMPDLAATNGWLIEKVEGFAVAKDRRAYIVTDNDGVDDSSGETQLLRLGRLD